MQKVKKWAPLIMAAFTILLCASCQDWGETDSPSGNQVYPKLEKIVTYSFEEEIDPAIIQLYAYSDGNIPTLVNDDERKSSVLHLNGGYAHIDNPLNSVKAQNGVSLTFWMKQVVQTGENSEQDLDGALFSFQNENGTQKFFFTANGWLSYDGVDGKYEDNNPSDYKTGLLTAGEWHYVAMTIRDNGYVVYVDGQKKIDKEVTEFDFSKIVQFMASVPSLYLGYGSGSETQEWMLDDLTIYRNQITDSQIKVPGTGGEEEENNYIIVGNEDMSTPWWSAFSDLVTMQGDQTIHYGFYNHTNGATVYNNWVLILTDGKDQTNDSRVEYLALRADAFGWGTLYSADNVTSNYNMDTFTSDMKGAYVDLTIKRTGNRIQITAVTTTAEGTVYTMNNFIEGTLSGTIGAILTCEGSYLEIDPETVYVGQQYAPDTYLVGPADMSAGWWSYFSNFSIVNTTPFVYTFINNSNATANWNNWLLVVTNGKDRGEAGYAEYFVVRADAFGWGPEGSNYNAANISASYDWDSFATQMKGAHCMIILERNGNRLDMTAKVTTADGVKLGDYTFFYEGITTDIGAFLTVELASLNMRTVGYYPFLNAAE
ncbi:LamG-like jellyroll fold domain-containing protein [uncultured Dysgonomonas sp.]|uniref:Concanavalin A-like lectin/glucanases superfamily protein n=1 Tax=uncultured Dysgonomonas sp. TaxID=206096 RepID=A0A212JB62_9BACT|nr:LamG-like jellyroll fold domain-containing protein [uncultured Dysgonomonas sp.]SBV96475.1 conserved exported hypothetical protein [uncultured Dysgonomonas sp.]